MELFKGRPLCIIITFCLLIIAGCAFCPVAIGLIIPAVAAGLLVAFVVLALRRAVDVKYAVIVAVAFVLIATSGIRGHFYYNRGRACFEKYCGSEVSANLTVIENLYYNRYSSTMRVKVNTLYGEKIDSYALLECNYEAGFSVGDVIELPIVVHPLSKLVEDETYTELSALSYGFLAYCTSDTDNGRIITSDNGFVQGLQEINEGICADLVYYLGDKAGGLASALSLGNQRYVTEDVERDFRRTGLAHILALSGSHIILIIGTADAILLRLFMGKKLRSLILFLLVPLYVIFVMTPIPALRAGIMYMLFLLSYYFRDDSDAVTNLFLSVFIIVIIMPSAVFSASLWMSFAATLLMVILMPRISYILSVTRSKLKSKWMFDITRAIALAAVTAILGTVANIIFSYALFGSLSTVTVVTNVIFGPILTILLVIYMLMIPFLQIATVAKVISLPIRYVTEFVLACINRISELKYAVISLKSDYAQVICIAVFLILIVFLLFKFKRKLLISVPLVAMACLLAFYHLNFASNGDVTISYAVRGTNEQAVIRRGDDFAIIDSSDGRYSNFKHAVDNAVEAGATEIETIVLTHYHSYHPSSLRRIFNREIVRYLVLPMPDDETDRGILQDLLFLCEDNNVIAVIVEDDSKSAILESVLYQRILNGSIKRSAHPTIAYELYIGKDELVYVGSAVNEADVQDRIADNILNADTIVFGRHGPVPKKEYAFDIHEGAVVCSLNEEILPFLAEISQSASIVTGKEIWFHFSP